MPGTRSSGIRSPALLLAAAGMVLGAHRAAAAAPVSGADQQMLASLKPPLLHLAVSSPYGERLNPVRRTRAFHAGVDYAAPAGTPVYAAQSGTIEALGRKDRSGLYLRLRHSRGVETVYAHLHRFMPGLRPGSYLRGGDIIGFVGASGFATGPHLHYEVVVDGRPVDPVAGDGKHLALASALPALPEAP